MKIEEVPQDLKYCEGAVVRDQNYAVDEEGRYHMVKVMVGLRRMRHWNWPWKTIRTRRNAVA